MKGFEERLSRLEEITEKVQAGNLPLEEAVGLFEEGIGLARGLEKDLGKIERKIEVLMNQPDKPEETPEMELFPELVEKEKESE